VQFADNLHVQVAALDVALEILEGILDDMFLAEKVASDSMKLILDEVDKEIQTRMEGECF
jgi:hypothetical protein